MVVPLARRPRDFLLVSFFGLYVFVCVFIDVAAVLEDNFLPGTPRNSSWPPEPVFEYIRWWGATFDPLMTANPFYYKACVWPHVIFQAPMAVLFMVGFTRCWNWIRDWVILWSVMVIYSTVLLVAGNLWDPLVESAPYPLIMASMYMPWVVFPLLAIVRVWGRNKIFPKTHAPAQQSSSKKNK